MIIFDVDLCEKVQSDENVPKSLWWGTQTFKKREESKAVCAAQHGLASE